MTLSVKLNNGQLYQVDTTANQLLGTSGEVITLQAKTMALFVFLLQHNHQVVTRGQIAEQVWLGTPVVDNAITNAIAKIRKALMDDPTTPTLLHTIPKVGYKLTIDTNTKAIPENRHELLTPKQRDLAVKNATNQRVKWGLTAMIVFLVCVVTISSWWVQRLSPTPAPQTAVHHVATQIYMAVLPFNQKGDSNIPVHVLHGITDNIHQQLSTNHGLQLLDMTTTRRPGVAQLSLEDMAQQLEISYVLSGSVQQLKQSYKIETQLTDIHSQKVVHRQSVSIPLNNLSFVSEKIVKPVLNVFNLSQQEKPVKPIPFAAYDLYLLGQFHIDKRQPESLQKAIALLSQATTLDPKMAPAFSALAKAYLLSSFYTEQEKAEIESLAEKAVFTALSLDSQLADAHAVLGFLKATFGDNESAMRSYLRALELAPNNAEVWMRIGLLHLSQWQYNLAVESLSKAVKLSPLDPLINVNLAEALVYKGDIVPGLQRYETVFAQPDVPLSYYRYAAIVASNVGRHQMAENWAKHAVITKPDDPLNQSALAYTYLLLGNFSVASEILQNIDAKNSSHLQIRRSYFLSLWLSGEHQALLEYCNALLEKIAASPSVNEKRFVYPVFAARTGIALLLNNQLTQAIEFLEHALNSESGQDPTFILEFRPFLSFAYQLAGEKALFTDSQEVLNRHIESFEQNAPNGVQIQLAKLLLLVMNNQLTEANNLLQHLQKLGWQPNTYFLALQPLQPLWQKTISSLKTL